MKLAIMQPYFFPYLGYYQLAKSADKFVFYDDVNYIKQGWINRNNILVNNSRHLFTVPIENQSSFKKIREIPLHPGMYSRWKKKWLATIEQAYCKAPYFNDIFPLISLTLENVSTIGELAKSSIKGVAGYLDLATTFVHTSSTYNNDSLKSQERVLSICKKENATIYINPIGGTNLYNKEIFGEHGIKLFFIESKLPPYKQFNNDFIPGLSIIDILMFNSKDEINKMLDEYLLK